MTILVNFKWKHEIKTNGVHEVFILWKYLFDLHSLKIFIISEEVELQTVNVFIFLQIPEKSQKQSFHDKINSMHDFKITLENHSSMTKI